ncbi:SgcJ/EcaC family oxidoreductase [Kibdelosporangium persicum]|uniref:SgcJ/EcaC family oxidoreductase n=1 Tax=Kibdelosporangium persicum TaxID=2698649 RepID=A0ABX2F858_9PSEU|nr:SgcJ/EcaC family oxidoreductase [Kibdelosporangium persicum]NRN67536.1 SgcJ/EcaC family oxidoreductase [Kibdelosporangium persicum]
MDDIKQVVLNSDTLQDDPDGFADLLTEDVNLVNIAGHRLHGRETVRAAYRKAMASQLAQVRTRIEIHDAWLVRPDVAVVSATKHVSDERAEPNAPLPDKGAVTFVLARQDEQWLIASVQTTPVK